MSNNEIAKILDAHSVPHYTDNDRIYADSMESNTSLFEKVEDLTGYSLKRLRFWLGY